MISIYCRALIQKKGRNNVTVDDLVHVITPEGRGGDFFLQLLFYDCLQRSLALLVKLQMLQPVAIWNFPRCKICVAWGLRQFMSSYYSVHRL
uniref:Transcription and mRNA export factor SUS1 n=1 Tax=Rhizophora mucronata TaxID=61149 RepID=A0A2P2K9Y7_RHIMU